MSTEQQCHRRKVREPLEIKKAKTNKRTKVLNCDKGNPVKTISGTPIFVKLTEKETNADLMSNIKMVLIVPCILFTFENGFD